LSEVSQTHHWVAPEPTVPEDAGPGSRPPADPVRTALAVGAPGPAAEALRTSLRDLGFGPVDPRGRTVPDVACAVSIGNAAFGAPDEPQTLPREQLQDTARRMAERGGGRLVLVTDGGPQVHPGACGQQAGRHAADLAWWQHLASRSAGSRVLVNTVGIGYAPFLGHDLPQARRTELLRFLAVRRPAAIEDLTGALSLLSAESCTYMVAERIPLDGGLDLNRVVVPRGNGSSPRPAVQNPSSTGTCRSAGERTCLVVGASSGIGRAVALHLAGLGTRLVLTSRRERALTEVAAQAEGLGAKAHVLTCDVSDPHDAADAVDRAFARAGRIDQVVYAAGQMGFGHSVPGTSGPFAVNLFGYMAVCERVTDRWRRERLPGSIVGISSVGGECVPVPHVEEYGASKAAMIQYSRCLASSTARHGIRINCVSPGIIRTAMGDIAGAEVRAAWVRRIPAGRAGFPPEVAPAVAWLLDDSAGYVTGATIRVDGGYRLGGLPSPAVPDGVDGRDLSGAPR
jgi:NAD(P)-dependent dehydrogenase (short-subunit alcohol dehydrogenase family)